MTQVQSPRQSEVDGAPEPSHPTVDRPLAQRLRDARCRGRVDLQCSRHLFRGEPTYVLRDPLTFETHRLSREDYHIFSRLTKQLTLGQLFDQLCEDEVLQRSQETSFYQFVVRLQQQGLLSLPGNAAPLYQNHLRRVTGRQWRTTKLFFLRVPLFNPDALLNRTVGWFRPIFSRPAIIAWALLMLACGVLLISQWREFVHPLSGMLRGHTFLIAWTTLLGLKVVHEFGHAYACKHFGGDVPEMGAYFIVFNPCAYVDASAAWGMPNRWQRIAISLGGMYFESFVGAAALIVWTLTDSGLTHDVAHHLVVMATTVTVLFNANPLMRYDGYFILCDLWGRPNLRRESIGAAQTLLKRLALGLHTELKTPWGLVTYGIAASIYKLTVVMALSLIVSQRFLWLGVGMAAMYCAQSVGASLFRAVRYLLFAPETRTVRCRARFACLTLLAAPWALLWAPVPSGAVAHGTMARQHEASVYLREAGVLEDLHIQTGDQVMRSQSLAVLQNDSPVIQIEQAHAEWAATARQHAALLMSAHTDQAELAQARVKQLHATAQAAQRHHQRLNVPSPVSGQVISLVSSSQIGAHLDAGTRIATVANGPWTARVLISEHQMAAMRPQVGVSAICQLDAVPHVLMKGTITMVSALGDKRVRNPRLTQMGGGAIAVMAHHGGNASLPSEVLHEATETASYQSLSPYYEVEISIDPSTIPASVLHGMKVQTRLNANGESIGGALWRRGRRFWDSMWMH